jgi:hypothetical protein
VDQLVPPRGIGRLGAQHASGERAQLGRQVLLGETLERPGDDVPHQNPGGHLDDGWLVPAGGPREDFNLDPGLGQPPGDLDDVDVHASGVTGTRLVER